MHCLKFLQSLEASLKVIYIPNNELFNAYHKVLCYIVETISLFGLAVKQ